MCQWRGRTNESDNQKGYRELFPLENFEHFTFEKFYAASGGLRALPLGIPLGKIMNSGLPGPRPTAPALWAVSHFAVLQNCPPDALSFWHNTSKLNCSKKHLHACLIPYNLVNRLKILKDKSPFDFKGTAVSCSKTNGVYRLLALRSRKGLPQKKLLKYSISLQPQLGKRRLRTAKNTPLSQISRKRRTKALTFGDARQNTKSSLNLCWRVAKICSKTFSWGKAHA